MNSSATCILALDTSRPACDVAVLRGSAIIAHRTEAMAKGQAERLLGLCTELMEQACIEPDQLTGIGVGIGPGNFTGIRISVATARGMALGLGVPAIGVSTFESLRYGFAGPCLAAVNAPRDQVYVQSFGENGPADAPIVMAVEDLARADRPVVGAGGTAPMHPGAVAIAHIASERSSTPQPRPAPLYIRPADAAPGKDAAPVILT